MYVPPTYTPPCETGSRTHSRPLCERETHFSCPFLPIAAVVIFFTVSIALVLVTASHLPPTTCCGCRAASRPGLRFGIWMEFCLLGVDQSCSTSFPDVFHWSVSNLVLASWQSWLPSGLNYGLRVIYITVLHAAPSATPRLIQSDLRLWPSHSSSHPIRYIEYVSQVFPFAYSPPQQSDPSALDSSTLKSSFCKDRILSPQNAAVRRAEGPVESGPPRPHKVQHMDLKVVLRALRWTMMAVFTPNHVVGKLPDLLIPRDYFF